MRAARRSATLGAVAVATAAVLTACTAGVSAGRGVPQPATTAPTTAPGVSAPAVQGAPASSTTGPLSGGMCHRGGTASEPTPDQRCTPGATNPAVTQDTIGETICKSGWTATVRPPTSYTNRLKREQIAAYGYVDTNPRDYEEDHDVAIEIGGSPTDPRNLWPEPGATQNLKDRVEGAAHSAVCDHRMSLAEAQHDIATDWVGLGHRLGVL